MINVFLLVLFWCRADEMIKVLQCLCLTRDHFYLISFKNGSFTRETIRDEFAEGSWECFSSALRSTPMGNNGNIGDYTSDRSNADITWWCHHNWWVTGLVWQVDGRQGNKPYNQTTSNIYFLFSFFKCLHIRICLVNLLNAIFLNQYVCFSGMYFDVLEITPPVAGVHRFDAEGQKVSHVC